MTRSIFAHGLLGLTACGLVAILAAPGCKATGVGDPCIPEQEYNQEFSGFDDKEVNIESKSFQCQTRVCLVYHFRGRVSCPYGQNPEGQGPAGGSACTVPGEKTPITGDPGDPNKALVRPQCSDRTTDKAVYCSCRCANVDGKTDDGANYCSCPDGFTCQPLDLFPIPGQDTFLTGSYCVKSGTEYSPLKTCVAESCNPNGKQCH